MSRDLLYKYYIYEGYILYYAFSLHYISLCS